MWPQVVSNAEFQGKIGPRKRATTTIGQCWPDDSSPPLHLSQAPDKLDIPGVMRYSSN